MNLHTKILRLAKSIQAALPLVGKTKIKPYVNCIEMTIRALEHPGDIALLINAKEDAVREWAVRPKQSGTAQGMLLHAVIDIASAVIAYLGSRPLLADAHGKNAAGALAMAEWALS